MIIIEIGHLAVRHLKDGKPIPGGWAELVGELDVDANGNVTSVPMLTPPYHRPRTQADIDAAVAAAILAVQVDAKAFLDAQQDRQAALLRAAVKELAVYTRDAHRNLNRLLGGIAAANNLADVKTAAAAITQSPAPANDATLFAGARAAIKARLDAGEADT